MKTERIGQRTYRTHNHVNADVFDYIERFHDLTRPHSTLGYLSPRAFEKQMVVTNFVSTKPGAANWLPQHEGA